MATKEIQALEVQVGDHILQPPNLEGYVALVIKEGWGDGTIAVRYTDRTGAVMKSDEVLTIEDHR